MRCDARSAAKAAPLRIRCYGFLALANGDYLIGSPFWDVGGLPDVGALTRGSGTQGVAGPITALNSLIGSAANDLVGVQFFALKTGIVLALHPQWNATAGAINWIEQSTTVSGVLGPANSLVGSGSERLGAGPLLVLDRGICHWPDQG